MADLSFSVEDDVVTSESTNPNQGWEISAGEDSVTSESLGYYPDQVTVGEGVTVSVFQVYEIGVADSSAVNESLLFGGPISISVSEDVVASDEVGKYPDTVVVTEVVQLAILLPFNSFVIDDTVTSESVTVLPTSSFGLTNPKKIIAEQTDPLTIRIETKAF